MFIAQIARVWHMIIDFITFAIKHSITIAVEFLNYETDWPSTMNFLGY